MKSKNLGIVIFCSLLLSSCGLIEKFKSPESATSSSDAPNNSTTSVEGAAPSDDLFNNAPDTATANNETHTDAPSNITTDENRKVAATNENKDDDLASLQNEFSGSSPQESSVQEVPSKSPVVNPIAQAPEVKKPAPTPSPKKVAAKKAKATPIKIQEEAPAPTELASEGTGTIKNYKVLKGETLMQIAFKLYGDISKWKDIRKLNGDKLSSNASLRSNLTLKYEEPSKEFVWNPEGTAYLIKNGETLGTISNSVYKTPKKWKTIWENNKPLIKNPNIIYAGFTLYYKGGDMANYVQPESEQPKQEDKVAPSTTSVEEIKVEKALTEIERLDSGTEEIKDIRSSTVRKSGVRAPSQEDVIPDTGSNPPLPDDPNEDVTPE